MPRVSRAARPKTSFFEYEEPPCYLLVEKCYMTRPADDRPKAHTVRLVLGTLVDAKGLPIAPMREVLRGLWVICSDSLRDRLSTAKMTYQSLGLAYPPRGTLNDFVDEQTEGLKVLLECEQRDGVELLKRVTRCDSLEAAGKAAATAAQYDFVEVTFPVGPDKTDHKLVATLRKLFLRSGHTDSDFTKFAEQATREPEVDSTVPRPSPTV